MLGITRFRGEAVDNRRDTSISKTEWLSPIPALVLGAVLLLLAVMRMPYGYYVFMRWIVCLVCVYGAWAVYQNRSHVWTWVLGATAVLFNPIIPFHMHRADWVPFNLAGAALLIAGAFILGKRGWRGMKATLSLVMFVLVGLVGFATAQSATTIYVADPGKGFGPIPVGRVVPKHHLWFLSFGTTPFVPQGWTIRCAIPDGTDDATYYYTSYGLRLHVEDSDVLSPEESTAVDIIPSGPLRDSESVFFNPDRERCLTPEGRPVSIDARLALPRDATYITTRGIQLGATLREVVATYAPLARIHRGGTTEITVDFDQLRDLREIDPKSLDRVEYCMVAFTMRAGHVENIRIDAYRGWKDCPQR